MKRKNLDKMFDLIDDDILEEADPIAKKRKSKESKFLWLQIATIAACLILTLNMAIMIPIFLSRNGAPQDDGRDIIKNTDSEKETDTSTETEDEGTDTDVKIEYIQNVTNIHINVPGKGTNVISLSSPRTETPSEYDKIVSSMHSILDGSFGGIANGNPEFDDSPGEDAVEDTIDKSEQDSKYEETTDNQVTGVIEGDLIKRSSEYIYYLSGQSLKIYQMKGIGSPLINQINIARYIDEIEKSLKFSSIALESDVEAIDDGSFSQVREMFLSLDLKTVTILVEHYVSSISANSIWYMSGGRYTSLISINVEDPSNLYLNNITTLFGGYESARLVDGEFLVFTRHAPTKKELSVPQYNDGDGFEYIPIDNIYTPNKYRCGIYLLAFKIDEKSGDVKTSYAVPSFDGEIYVSNDNIYITRQYRGEEKKNEKKYPIFIEGEEETPENIKGYGIKYDVYSVTKTEILRIDYSGGGFKEEGITEVNGYIKDRYSLSENNGQLYVVTTDDRVLSMTVYDEGDIGKEVDWIGYRVTTSASIFIIDVETMERLNAIERFSPENETVRSVRFDGHLAYVCTAVQVTDPVFFFNLEDVNNITYSDTGTIPGFSTQLIELPNGDLLGIGLNETRHIKIETYRLGEGGTVAVVDTYLIYGTYSTDYKSHFINRELGLIGLGIRDNSQKDPERYIMLQYKDGEFSLVFDTTLRGDNASKRAVYDSENGFFYLLSDSDFAVLFPLGKVKK